MRIDKWRKPYDTKLYTVSHCQGSPGEQLQLPALEDNEQLVAVVNKGRHAMTVRSGDNQRSMVDFRPIYRVFKKRPSVLEDCYLGPKADFSCEMKDMKLIASVSTEWCNASHP